MIFLIHGLHPRLGLDAAHVTKCTELGDVGQHAQPGFTLNGKEEEKPSSPEVQTQNCVPCTASEAYKGLVLTKGICTCSRVHT